MYGYVIPPTSVTPQELTLFNSFYCGLCIRTGKLMGQRARLTTNFDMTFLNVLLHDLLSQSVEFKATTCLLSPFRKKAVVDANPLLDKIAAVNIILSYYKATDGIVDGEGLKYRVARASLASAYEKSKKMLPRADEIVSAGYERLRKLEDANAVGIDRVSDAFALMMQGLASLLLGENASDDSLRLIYNIGKFVYLADALDDIDEDAKAKRYNPFLAQLEYKTRKSFLAENKEYLERCFNMTVNRAIECFNGLDFTQSYDLLRGIVYYGLRQKTKELLSSSKKLKKPIIKADVKAAKRKNNKENTLIEENK